MPLTHELQEVVVLLSKLITQMTFVLTSKTDHLFSSIGIKPSSVLENTHLQEQTAFFCLELGINGLI